LIGLNPGQHPVNYDFCIMTPGTISGYAFQDGPALQAVSINSPTLADVPASELATHTGVRAAGDTMLAGVVLTLADANGNPLHDVNGNLIQTTTDANGFYIFKNLLPGNYTVLEGGASGYYQWINTPGSTGGTAPYRGTEIMSISLAAGQSSVENDFSFVQVTPFLFFFPPTFTAPPPPPANPQLPGNPQPALFQQQVLGPIPQNPTPPGSGADGYTWHLSVINAGQPRSLQNVGDAIAQFTSANTPDLEGWANGALAHSTWLLRTDDDGQEQVTKLVFGMRGGVPVTGDYDGDGRTDIGIFLKGQWFVDLNGNGIWDTEDLWAKLGYRDDLPITGDWDGDGKTDIAIFGKAWPGDPNHIQHEPGLPNPDNARLGRQKNVPPRPDQATYGVRTMQRTSTGKMRADLIDHVFNYGAPGDWPIAGAFNGSGIDTIGVFRDGKWHLDLNGDGRFQKTDLVVNFGQPGDLPVIGDFNGDGIDELGVYRDGLWMIDTNGDRSIDDGDLVVNFGGPGDKPIVGDWNGDGRDDMGVYQEGAADVPTPEAQGEL
ncbi:MAG TPA: SdrD B-like domain-containing protein, partial [Pirellulales bacterium]|nr:SdrD B-like domain-containing protein [Pirellulales bacterium]